MSALNNRDLDKIFQSYTGDSILKAELFSTGLSLFVYDVITKSGNKYVVRIAPPDRKSELEDGIYWQKKLEHLPIPLPELFHTGQIEDYSFAIYERIPGDDLEIIYHKLSSNDKKNISHQVADIQQEIHTLNEPSSEKSTSWVERVQNILNRSERQISKNGLCDKRYIERVKSQIQKNEDYLSSVTPIAFLYDLNVRNVIIYNSRVNGIIDVDEVWFGDPLLTIGRGKALLLSMNQNIDYIHYWCEYLNLSDFQKSIVDLYALLYSLRFMGTLGQTLNGNYSSQTDPKNAKLFETIADNLLIRLA